MRAFTAVLTLAILLLYTSVATASAVKTLPPGVPETLAVSFLPDGTAMVWYHVAYPIEALEETAQLVAKTTAEGATLTILVTPSTETYPAQLEVFGQNLDAVNASTIATAFGKALDIPLTSSKVLDGYTTYTATIDRGKLARLIEELRPQTREGGFSPYVDMGYLNRFQWAQVLVEIVKTGWGVATSFEVRGYGVNASVRGDIYEMSVVESLGVSELKPSKDGYLNVIFILPPDSKLVSYRLSPGELKPSSITSSLDSLYLQLQGNLYIREFAVKFEYRPVGIDSLFKQLTAITSSAEEIKKLAPIENKTSDIPPLLLDKLGKQLAGVVLDKKTSVNVVNVTATTEPKAVGEKEVHGGWSLPRLFSLENLSRIDPPIILMVAPLASALMVFTVVYVRGGPRRASKGAAAATLAVMLFTSTVTPLLTVRAVLAEQAGGGLEPLLEVEQFIPDGAPEDLEIPLLFPAFQKIDAITRTFINFTDVMVFATPSLRAPYNPKEVDLVLATIGIDPRFIELAKELVTSAGLVLSGKQSPLDLFKRLSLVHKGTSAFLPHEDVGANVYIVFKAKPTKTLETILIAINVVYLIGYYLRPFLAMIGLAIMIAAIIAAVALAMVASVFKVSAYASYPTSVNSLRTAWVFENGLAKATERKWLSEERFMISLPILVFILSAVTSEFLKKKEELKKLADQLPLTASFHISSKADSGWTLTSLLGFYSGENGLWVGIDFRDAALVGSLFESLTNWFKNERSELVKETAKQIDKIREELSHKEGKLNSALLDLGLILPKLALNMIDFGIAGKIINAQAKIFSAQLKIDGAKDRLSNAKGKIENCEFNEAQRFIQDAQNYILVAIKDLESAIGELGSARNDLESILANLPKPAEENKELEDRRKNIQELINDINRVISNLNATKDDLSNIRNGLGEFSQRLGNVPPELCSLPDSKEEPKEPQKPWIKLAYVVLPATPLVTKAEHAKDQTNLTLRAYYGWNPMPQIVQATALKVRESFETIREISYNRLDKFSSVTSAIQTLAAPLNKGIEGILGGVKSENAPKELLGPLQNFYEKIEKELYDLITNSLDSFFDKLKDIIIEFSSETLEKMIESITGYFVNATKDWIGKEWNWILDKLLDHFKLRVFDLSKIISKMILSLIGNFIEIDLEEEINNMNKKIEGEIDKLKKITSDFIEKIKEKWDQIVTDFVEKRLDTIHKVLFDVKLRITKMSDSGGLNIGTTLLDVTNNFMSSLSKGGGTAVEAVRKLNGVEREILGVFIKARDATTYLSSLIRIPILGREGKLQATIIGLGNSTVSDNDGYLGTIVIPHSQLKSVAGWYNEYPLVLHPAGLTAPIPADYSLISPEIEELRDSLGAAPPSVLWVKVNEVGPVLKGGRIEIAILGDPTRPSAPHGTKILVYRHDGSVEKKNLGDLPFIGSSNPSSVGGGFAPYIPFPIGQQSLKGLDALEPGSLMVSYYVSVFEEEHVEDPSARAVPRILVPADTATGTLLVIPYLPFPQPAS
jgi:hypothetical protein